MQLRPTPEGLIPRWRADAAYSWAGICCSMSRQALILRRRHTQHSGSLPPVEVSPPQTVQRAGFFSRSGEMASFACSSISAGTTVSVFGCALRLMAIPDPLSLSQKQRVGTTHHWSTPYYAASGICTTVAGSSEAEQRGHFCPRATLANFPLRSISAGTVWVQMGQWTCPWTRFSTSAFIAVLYCLTSSDAKSAVQVVGNS